MNTTTARHILVGDDCLTKHFSPRELLARVRAVLRRCQARPVLIVTERGAGHRLADDVETLF